MRPIDADALKEDLTRFYFGEVTARDLIDEQPTIGGWTSVKDRLPRLRQWVLCKCRAGIYEVLRYEETCDGERWHHDNRHNYMIGFVTHWMPLPEPAKET